MSASASTPASMSARKVKFVASDPNRGGLPVKRKQVQQACVSCRRKKRRCSHAEDAATMDESTPEEHRGTESSPSQASPVALHHIPPRSSVGPVTGEIRVSGVNTTSMGGALPAFSMGNTPNMASSRLSQDATVKPQASRFVGDLNPEGMFMEVTASGPARDVAQTGDVGVWFSAGINGGSNQPSQFITRPPPIMDRFMLPFVREFCLSSVPPESDFVRLRASFLQKIHPMFPVIPVVAINAPMDGPQSIVIRQLVCLAACSDPEMVPYLRLQNHGPHLLQPSEYSQALSSAIRAILETSVIADRVLHIRALTMLSLYTQPTCPEEADLPAQLGGRAIHHIQTLGLHLLKYESPDCDDLENLFCAVWALDRINAAMYGRPCLIHERDIGADLESCMRKRQPCFRLLLAVVQWLDQVIELYRPGPSAEASGLRNVAYIDLPVLEAMIVNSDSLKIPSSLIATIETFYHAVIILSCRLPRPGTITAASTLPPPSANARRSLAAERIACAIPRDCLSPLPIIPYAVSLALSVEYRKMRHSRLPMFRARAMNSFKRNCELLRMYGDHFWSAKVVAGLGERVLKEMERAATSLATREATPQPADTETKPAMMGQGGPVHRDYDIHSSDAASINSGIGVDNAVDFSLIDAISGQDVFGHIDPSFNLDAVEEALEANLDIGLPLNWGDWGHSFMSSDQARTIVSVGSTGSTHMSLASQPSPRLRFELGHCDRLQ